MVPKTPYKIIGYQKKSESKSGIEVDASELTVENQETGQKIVLIYNRPVNDPTVYALFKYLWMVPRSSQETRALLRAARAEREIQTH